MQKFKDYLHENGLRCTSERLDIAKAVLSLDNVFTAEELLVKIKGSGWPVSKATLYRCIPLLIESGMIKLVSPNQLNNHLFKRPDKNDSFISTECQKCGKVLSFQEELIADINRLAEKYEFEEIIDNLIMLKGVCPTCIQQLTSLTSD